MSIFKHCVDNEPFEELNFGGADHPNLVAFLSALHNGEHWAAKQILRSDTTLQTINSTLYGGNFEDEGF